MLTMKKNVVDFFSGAGGLSLGFQNAGFNVVGVYDNWDVAIETYQQNFPKHNARCLDLMELKNGNNSELKSLLDIKPDVVMGGPPCQDFSSAGKRNGNGERGNLTPLFARLAVKLEPKWIVMENVSTIKSTGEKQLSKAIRILKSAKYGITTKVLNAADFGVPQSRKRMFIIARKGGKDGELTEHLERQKTKRVSVKEYFEKNDIKLPALHYYRHPRSYHRRAIFSVDELSPTIRGVNRPMPKTYRHHKRDSTNVREEITVFTSNERAIIQSFPKEFRWIGNKSEVEQQIGNAVPPLLASAVAKAILSFEKGSLTNY